LLLSVNVKLDVDYMPEKITESKNLKELLNILEDLKNKGIKVVVKICPVCKSPQIQFMKAKFDILGTMGIARPKFLCKECGYWGRVAIELTNEELSDKILDKILYKDKKLQKLLKELKEQIK